MRYILNSDDVDIRKFVEELGDIDGVNVIVEDDDYEMDMAELRIVIKVSAIKLELDRILILLETQNEVGVAMDKLKDLIELFDKINEGFYDIEV